MFNDRGEHLARDPLRTTVDRFGLRFRLEGRARRGDSAVGDEPVVAGT